MEQLFLPKIFIISGNLTQVLGGKLVAMCYRLDGIQLNYSSDATFAIERESELFEIGDIVLATALNRAQSSHLSLENPIQFDIKGNVHGVKETMVYASVLIVEALAKSNRWQLSDIDMAQFISMVLMDIDDQMYVLNEILMLVHIMHHRCDLVYVDTLSLTCKGVELIQDVPLTIEQIPTNDAFDFSTVANFIKECIQSLQSLAIFMPIHSLGQVRQADLSEYGDYLDDKAFQAVQYVVFESQLSDTIAASGQLSTSLLIKYLKKKPKFPFFVKQEFVESFSQSYDYMVVNRKYIYCLHFN